MLARVEYQLSIQTNADMCHLSMIIMTVEPQKMQMPSCRLAGMLGLDSLSDDLLAALAACAGVEAPAAPGSPAEAKQLASLARLVALAGGREAGFLGGGWVTVLRLLSALDLLKVRK